jgi:hypothetical protein
MTRTGRPRIPTRPKQRKRPGPKPGSEAAKRGGYARLNKYGLEAMREMARSGGRALVDRYGPEYMAAIGRTGMLSYWEQYSHDFLREKHREARAKRRGE